MKKYLKFIFLLLIVVMFVFSGCGTEKIIERTDTVDFLDSEVVIDEESELPLSDVELIGKYYGYFWVDELEKAYEMKFEPEEDFETFESWYKDVLRAEPYVFKQIGEDRYRFVVDYFEDSGENQRYEVEMEIINGKLKTIYSKQLTDKMIDEKVVFDANLNAYVEWDNGSTYLYVSKSDGTVLTVDSITKRTDWSDKFAKFFDLEFSKSGRYLIYSITAWEATVFRIYDIQEQKLIHSVGIAGGGVEVSYDESHMIECEGTGMSSGFIRVYTLPDLELKADLYSDYAKDYMAGGCTYDSKSNTLRYSLTGYGQEGEIWKSYEF